MFAIPYAFVYSDLPGFPFFIWFYLGTAYTFAFTILLYILLYVLFHFPFFQVVLLRL